MQSSSIAADAPGSLPHSPAAAPSSHFHAAKINLPRFGMFTFLASEAMLFAGLICAYLVLRSSLGHNYRPEEAPMLPWKLTGINTIILLSSSFTCWLAERQVVRNIRPTLWLFATATLGAIFVSIQGVEWTNLYHEHMWFNKAGEGMPNGHVYSSVFFTLTGFHGAHVAIGVIMLFFCTAFSFFGKFSAHHHTLLECTSLYWHFVDVVWVILFFILYIV